MTLAPTRVGSRNFSRDMKEIKHVIEGLAESVIKKVAVKTLGNLIKRSPILTGHYVRSHKVSQDVTDTPEKSNETRYMDSEGAKWSYGDAGFSDKKDTGREQKNRRSAASSANITGLNAIGKLKNPKRIRIRNHAFYAQLVESGWPSGALGYFVYAHTANDMLEETPQIIKEEEAKAQAKLNEL